MKTCKAMDSDFVTQQFEAELEKSKWYRLQSVTYDQGDLVHWEVWHQHTHTNKKRIVAVVCVGDTQRLKCLCLTEPSQGMPCRLVYLCLLVVGKDLFLLSLLVAVQSFFRKN